MFTLARNTAIVSSPANRLALELWLLILEQPSLDYFDLKAMGRVCKGLRELQQKSTFDLRLFRSPPPSNGLKKGSRVQYHPLHDQADLGASQGKWTAVRVKDETAEYGEREVPLEDLFSATEFATAPACRNLSIDFGVVVADPNGVKVLDFVKACVEFWSSPAPPEDAEEIAEMYGNLDVAKVTMAHTLIDRVWTVFARATVISKDWVQLGPSNYDS
ncbi:hypothetical protein JCM8547_002184 [Rhodosporidiobolus lusitaniae]